MAKIYYNDNGTWKVVNVLGGGSGGGAGDVTAAGDNTFTGKNTYRYLYNGSQYGEVRIFPSDYDKLTGTNAITIGNNYKSSDSNLVTLGCNGISILDNYKSWLKSGSLQLRSSVADAGIELSIGSGPPTAVINTKHYSGDVTGVITIPYGQTGTMVVDSNLKTLFGNQNIVGSGNIDLYKHVIKFSGSTSEISTECYCVVYSSKNLNVDSLTDLKTLLGNTFVELCTGNVRYKTQQDNAAQALLVKESGIYYCLGGSSYYMLETAGWTGITISDTVTTV